MEIFISFAAKVAEYLVAPIRRPFSYLLCYNKNIENFKSQIKKLEEKNLGVQGDVDVASRNCESVKVEVTSWLERANKKQADAKEMLEGDEKVGKSCLNIKSRYMASKKASKLTKKLVEIIAEGVFDEVANPPEPIGLVHAPPLSSQTPVGDMVTPLMAIDSSREFESRSHIVRDIMISLKDDKVRVIGIWGMGGVGKTTMANEVVDRVRKEGNFEEVAMVVVSQEPDLKKVQDDIAEQLGLSFTEQSLSTRAQRLRQRLTQQGKNNMPKKILIILDDVWARLGLSEVGIPSANDNSNCKILLTSRNKGVCDQMRTDRTHIIEVLNNKEAWELFHKTAGVSSDATDLFPIANDIVQECNGLPIAITTIAGVLVGCDKDVWEWVLRKLKDSTLEEGEYARVYSVFGVSYDSLTSDEVRELFLLCCLFPEDFDIPIEELVRYGVGRKLFKGIKKLHVRRKDGHVYIKELQKSSLLLESDKVDCVKLHDLVRDFALSTGSKGKFFVKFGEGIKEWPIEDVNECYTSISLQCNEMDVLPGGLKYPNLNTLLLAGSEDNLLIFPELFFEGMRKVEVLVLKYVSIKSLPESLQFLKSLRTLSLNHCRLEGDLSLIGELAVLEILSFAGADIQDLPVEIGKLSRLRLFDLTGCKKIRSISPGIIESLLQLEELYLRGTSIRWAEQVSVGDEGSSTVREMYASFSEVTSLSSLIVIEIDIPYEVLSAVDLMFLENLERFYVCVGGTYEIKIKNVFENILCCKVDKSILLDGIVHVLGRKTEVLYLKVRDLLTLPQEYSELGDLRLESCEGLLSLINIAAPSSMNEMAYFGKLRSIVVKWCHKLKSILPVSVVKGLANLERLEVRDCGAIEELFTKERGDEDEEGGRKIVLIRLQVLSLSNLPKLVCFCKGIDEIELPQLEELYLWKIPMITSIYSKGKTINSELPQASSNYPFFVEKVNTNNMAKMKLEDMRNLKEIWPAEYDGCLPNLACRTEIEVVSVLKSAVSGFCNLEEVEIKECPKLHNVFPSSIASGLVKLERLDIRDCGMVDSIIRSYRREDEEQVTKIQFPRLNYLRIESLDNLVHFCTSFEEVEFPKLEDVNLKSLPKFDGFASKGVLFNTKQVPKLDYLRVEECDSIEVVFDLQRSNEEVAVLTQLYSITLNDLKNVRHVWSKCPRVLPRGSLQNLDVIQLEKCDNLRYVFTPSIAKALVGLKFLKIENCMELEAIVAEEEDDKMEETLIILFPQLKTLWFVKLPKLQQITPEPTYHINYSSCKSLVIGGCRKLNETLTDTTLEVNTNFEQNLACRTEIEVVSLIKSTLSTFHNLEEVFLWSQPKFDGFYSKGVLFNTKQVPKLYFLEVSECESIEVVFDLQRSNEEVAVLTQLKRIDLLYLKNVRHVWSKCPRVLPRGSLQNLDVIQLEKCDNLRYVFTPSIAKALVGLKFLKIENCMELEAIVAEEEDDKMEETLIILFPQLTTLHLEKLPKLQQITPEPTYHINYSSCQILNIKGCRKLNETLTDTTLEQVPKLDYLRVEECDSIEVVFDLQRSNEEVAVLTQLKRIDLLYLKNVRHVWSKCPRVLPRGSLQNLDVIQLEKCDNLRYVFTPSIAKALVGLKFLKIENCMELEAIVAEEEDDKMEETLIILFPQLTTLHLEKLPKLQQITPEPTYHINYSSCQILNIKGCRKLNETLTDTTLEVNTNFEQNLACRTEIEVVSLIKSTLSTFHNLEEVFLWSQPKFDGFYSKGVLFNTKQVPKLYFLEVSECESIEVVFDLQRSNEEVAVLTQLKRIDLLYLKNVRHVWSKCPRVLPRGSLQNLGVIQLVNCDNLRYVFTPSIAKALMGLEDLNIWKCMNLEAIVAEEEDDKIQGSTGETIIILFPQLKTLILIELPNLQVITPEPTYAINLSSCKSLEMSGCGKLNKTSADTILEKIQAIEEEKEKKILAVKEEEEDDDDDDNE